MTDPRARIVPEVTALTEPYWEAARAGRLALQRCPVCERTWHPPEPVCPTSPGHPVEWITASGWGRLHSYTVVHHAAHPAVADALPYVVALVDLDEGPRLICNLLGSDPGEVTPFARVRLELGSTAAGETLPVARLAAFGPPGDGGGPAGPAPHA